MASGGHRSIASPEAQALARWYRDETRDLVEALAQLAPYIPRLPQRSQKPTTIGRQGVVRS